MPFDLIVSGFSLSAGLIIAIGAQNAFVLRQGLKRRHVFATAAVCILSDISLFTIGAVGFGTLVNQVPALKTLASWGGAIFVLAYGALSFRSALRREVVDIEAAGQAATTLRDTVLTALAVSLLNPHAILDTIVLVGGIAGQYPWEERVFFTAGAMLASFTWFTSLAYGAGLLAPIFRHSLAWRVLDGVVALIMWAIGFSLIAANTGL